MGKSACEKKEEEEQFSLFFVRPEEDRQPHRQCSNMSMGCPTKIRYKKTNK